MTEKIIKFGLLIQGIYEEKEKNIKYFYNWNLILKYKERNIIFLYLGKK